MMQYSPKLKKAMEEIKAILKKHDIAGMVVLHMPGHSEYHMKINPSYSCASIDRNMIRVKARLKADFQGDKKAWEQKVSDTSNMFKLLSEVGGRVALALADVSMMVDRHVDAEHNRGGYTFHKQQNN